jgi:hypothetical protein
MASGIFDIELTDESQRKSDDEMEDDDEYACVADVNYQFTS